MERFPDQEPMPRGPGAPVFRILAADKLAEEGLAFLRSQSDVQLHNRPGLNESDLAAAVREHDGMIVRSGAQVSAKVLSIPGFLRAIARAGVGVDNIDIEEATARGILVMNCAEANTISAAEHTFALLLALCRQIAPAAQSMGLGKWERSRFVGRQLHGMTLGIAGFGRIGQAVAERALGFGMSVVAYDPIYNAPKALDGRVKMYGALEQMLPLVDVVSCHVPLNEHTRGMLNRTTLGACRPGVLVLNVSRGGVVDEQALLEAVESGVCGGAALDVFETEPPPGDSPLRTHPRILVTPHLGASTLEAQRAVSIRAAEQLLAYLRGQGLSGAVNAGGLRVDLDPNQAAFVDLAQRMTQLLSPMLTQGIRAVTIELTGEPLEGAAGTIERTALVGLLASHLDTPLNVVNVRHVAEQRGISTRTIMRDTDKVVGEQLVIVVEGPEGARRIVGRVYEDMRPRVIEINGYHMDMVPTGHMVLIQNVDQPGMLGLVGTEFGQGGVNIADMAISRRDQTALMLLKCDAPPPEALIEQLRGRPGILKVAVLKLPEARPASSGNQATALFPNAGRSQ